MGKSGMGTGSASIVLIFVVLCLTIFALISLTTAQNDKALTDANAAMVKAYYDADAESEFILSEIAMTGVTQPGVARGVEYSVISDPLSFDEVVAFSVPVVEGKVLYVEAAFGLDGVTVMKRYMRDTDEWDILDTLPIWDGT